jgi:hypothetical protein
MTSPWVRWVRARRCGTQAMKAVSISSIEAKQVGKIPLRLLKLLRPAHRGELCREDLQFQSVTSPGDG